MSDSQNRIKHWIFCISGFRQHEGEMTGMQRLWLKLAPYRSSRRMVSLREWDADWGEVANLTALCSANGDTKVHVFGYSWGGGYGAIRLAEELKYRGIKVQGMVLSDPVWYGLGLIAKLITWRTDWPKIIVPANVERVKTFFQRENRPRAHAVVAASPQETELGLPVRRYRTHEWMDDDNLFHQTCIDMIEESLK